MWKKKFSEEAIAITMDEKMMAQKVERLRCGMDLRYFQKVELTSQYPLS